MERLNENSRIVCPFSMSGEIKQCHPLCKLKENGECLLVTVLKSYKESIQKD